MSEEPGGAPPADSPPAADVAKDGSPTESKDTAAAKKEDKDAAAAKKEDKETAAFKGAARNPLGDQARAAEEAYQIGRRYLRIDGPAAVIGEGRFQDFQVGDRFNFSFGRGPVLDPGRVPADHLDSVRVRYVRVTGYDKMSETLRERRLVVLCGAPSSGRSTTALRLLDDATGGKVFRLESVGKLMSIEAKDLDEGYGYLAELSAEQAMAEISLDRLCDLLSERRCCCVLLTENSFLERYTLDCPPPDQLTLLRRHISREAHRDDEEGMEQRLFELAATPRLRQAWGPAPQPRETVSLARLLVEHGRGKISIDQVEIGCRQSIDQQATEWFLPLRNLNRGDHADERLRLAGFRIALAVLNESPYHIVREFGERLAEAMMVTISPRRTPGRTLFSDDRQPWLTSSRAHLVDGEVSFGEAAVPVDLAKFDDDRFPVAVLQHVWRCHHNVRSPLIRWLLQMGQDDRVLVWLRSAQVAGLLCALDFPYTYYELVGPCADSEEEKQRRFAAYALDQAALDERIRPAVAELLRYWRRKGSLAEKWTAATALGWDLGLRSLETSLGELRIIGTSEEEREDAEEDTSTYLALASGHSLATLCTRGDAEPVLSRLNIWIRSDRRVLRHLALYTVLTLASKYGSDLIAAGALRPGSDGERALLRERRRWPVLLALREEDHGLTDRIADLLWHTLRSPANEVMSDILGGWMRAGQRDQGCLNALLGFLPYLIEDHNDANRLRYLVRRMRRNWVEPLREDTATRLEKTIDHALRQETVS